MTTLNEYKARGGFVAFVPDDATSHIITRSKTIRERVPPSPGWPEGTTITREGPETLAVEVVEGRRVVRFRTPADFMDLKNSKNGLAWERLNGDLIERIVAEQRHAGIVR